jgi:release factor glutamine methyltransferase
MPTIAQLLSTARAEAFGDSWLLETELLLMAALDCRRETLMTWPEREVAAEPAVLFERFVARRRRGEPIAYITGRRAFWDFELSVSPAVLIPRPETELLVEVCLELAAARSGAQTLLDLGTGSGAIAIALARSDPRFKVLGVDVSTEALAVARSNARRLAGGNLSFVEGSWLSPLVRAALAEEVDIIAANPPYIAPQDVHLEEGDLRFEPPLALSCGEQGLSAFRLIVEQSSSVLKPGGWLVFEHGCDQREAVAALMRRAGFCDVECLQDLAGLDRVTRGRRAS